MSEFEIITMVRLRCAKAFRKHPTFPFFAANRRPGEYPDECILRLFRAEKAASRFDDDAVVDALVYG